MVNSDGGMRMEEVLRYGKGIKKKEEKRESREGRSGGKGEKKGKGELEEKMEWVER